MFPYTLFLFKELKFKAWKVYCLQCANVNGQIMIHPMCFFPLIVSVK